MRCAVFFLRNCTQHTWVLGCCVCLCCENCHQSKHTHTAMHDEDSKIFTPHRTALLSSFWRSKFACARGATLQEICWRNVDTTRIEKYIPWCIVCFFLATHIHNNTHIYANNLRCRVTKFVRGEPSHYTFRLNISPSRDKWSGERCCQI